MCLHLLSMAPIKHQDQKQLGEERLYLISILLCSPTSKHVEVGTPSRNLGQSLKQTPWRSDLYWLALQGSLSLFSYRN